MTLEETGYTGVRRHVETAMCIGRNGGYVAFSQDAAYCFQQLFKGGGNETWFSPDEWAALREQIASEAAEPAPSTPTREQIIDEISGIQVASGFDSITIGYDAAAEVADVVMRLFAAPASPTSENSDDAVAWLHASDDDVILSQERYPLASAWPLREAFIEGRRSVAQPAPGGEA